MADASNEKGYYEHDQVAALLTGPDKSWLAGARGHSLKVVAPLLAALPLKISNHQSEISDLHYRILFMEREMEEILESQDSMLARLTAPTGPTSASTGIAEWSTVPEPSSFALLALGADGLQEFINDPFKESGHRLTPRGVFRFHSHEEADAWMRNSIRPKKG
ncbi:MAG: hypothetical protein ORN51_13145 [Akkermansiaceae bacterium]|nr:hypothetical protein [Akkermansiaceae bacterium]